jgi:hypothetical protein
MTRRALLLVAAGTTFALEPLVARLGVVASAAAMIALGVLLALTASGTLAALAAAGGALGAFAQGALATVSPAAAGAALVGICFAERTLRVRGAGPRLLHIGAALMAGAVAGTLASAYTGSPLVVRGVVAVVSAVLVALPTVVPADDPLAHALELFSEQVGEPARSTLEAGAALRREVDDEVLDTKTRREMRATWRALHHLAQARVRMERKPAFSGRQAARAVVTRLDQRLNEHVDVLTRAYTAVDTAEAAEISVDDVALDVTRIKSDTLEEVSAQLLEVAAVPQRVDACRVDDDGHPAPTRAPEVPELDLG